MGSVQSIDVFLKSNLWQFSNESSANFDFFCNPLSLEGVSGIERRLKIINWIEFPEI